MSYIGNSPGVASQRVVTEEVIAGSTKTDFYPVGGYALGYVDVLVNGIEIDSSDFTANDGVKVTLALAAQVGDTVKIKCFLPRGLTDGYTKSEADALLAVKQNAATAVTKDSPTGAALMPVGTNAQRPSVPESGMYRMNSDTQQPEWYDAANSQWVQFRKDSTYSASTLVVAGGGGGGAGSTYIQTGVGNGGGGGGGGGYLAQTLNFVPGTTYSIVVGAGGAGGAAANGSSSVSGSNSSIGSIATAIGGGGGGNKSNGKNGGSGGGASVSVFYGGTATTGQGYRGGNNTGAGSPGCGGGGAAAQGGDWTGGNYGSTGGGAGVSNSLSGSAVTYSAGGGGGAYISGSNYSGGGSASANTGGGGGGSPGADTGGGWYSGGNGGSGIVVIQYAGVPRATGGTITFANGYTTHVFTSSGNFVA